MSELTHVDSEGRARMVDVGVKPLMQRTARAQGHITLVPETLALITDNEIKKGDVLAVAQLAGIQAAKRTSELIPLCHPLALSQVSVHVSLVPDGALAESCVRCVDRTGVEMEALTAVSVALLTVYDMCKAVDQQMQISGIRLLEKTKHEL